MLTEDGKVTNDVTPMTTAAQLPAKVKSTLDGLCQAVNGLIEEVADIKTDVEDLIESLAGAAEPSEVEDPEPETADEEVEDKD